MKDETSKFNLKAMCIFHKDGKILVSKGFDKVKNEHFYRFLGGGVDFFETGKSAVRREIKEELHSEIENLEIIDVIENLFTFEGIKRHEIVFFYVGDLVNKELYKQNKIHVVEDTHEFDAEWISIDGILQGSLPLYPALDYKTLFSKILVKKIFGKY